MTELEKVIGREPQGAANGAANAVTTPQSVFVVRCSNCEPWEDYHTWIDSVWTSIELAVEHIERHMEFEREAGRHAGDRWVKEFFMYETRADYDSDEEWEEALADNDGKPHVVYSEMSDAWIEEYPLDKAKETT